MFLQENTQMIEFAGLRRITFLLVLLALTLFAVNLAGAQSQPVSRQISAGGTGVFQSTPLGNDGFQSPEIDNLDQDANSSSGDSDFVNRVLATAQPGKSVSASAGKKAKSNPELNLGFDGLNFRQQRLANGGRQFSVEPPDQGLCVGNGFVLESTNDVLNIFDTAGNPLLPAPADLNSFYGYAPAVIRGSPTRFGPSVTDPSCLFDQQTQRFFHVVLTLNRQGADPNTGLSTGSALSGANHLDVAVSDTSNPLGSWTIYRIPVQDDGTDGTPDHHCTNGGGPVDHPAACLGDYPHIGADANGIYLTTNEFVLFGPGFVGAQIYAISKSSLTSSGPLTVFQYDTENAPLEGVPGFTVWPAQSPGTTYATEAGGTEYFLSSFAVFFGIDNHIGLWALTNTQALNSGGAPSLSSTLVNTELYTNPPRAFQPGSTTADNTLNWPLGQCISDTPCDLFLNGIPGVPQVIGKLNSNDSRLQQVSFANGKLWGALGTGISTDGGATSHAGIAYFVIKPQVSSSLLAGKVAKQGYVALSDASVTYPTTAVTNSGRGVISFTVVGPNNYPSVGYASLDAIIGAGDVRVAQAGSGLQDGFTEYPLFSRRPRWGDYGAAAVDGNSIWFATEFINQNCSLATFESAPVGSCGGTRALLGNWATRITKVTP